MWDKKNISRCYSSFYRSWGNCEQLCSLIWQSRKTRITKLLTCQETRQAMKTLSYNEIIFLIQKPNISWWLCQTFRGMTVPTITQSFDIRRGRWVIFSILWDHHYLAGKVRWTHKFQWSFSMKTGKRIHILTLMIYQFGNYYCFPDCFICKIEI